MVKRYEQFLLKPNVGVALDSEWRMAPDQVPAKVRGHVTGAEVNAVTAYLSKLTVSHGLPQKVVVLHNFTQQMILDRTTIKARSGARDRLALRRSRRPQQQAVRLQPAQGQEAVLQRLQALSGGGHQHLPAERG